MVAVKQRKERSALRVIKGGLVPADAFTAMRLREKGYKVGDIVFAELRKPRNPGFWGLAHKFGEMLAQNIDSFNGMDAHKVLKRLQWEANIGCEEMGVMVPGIGLAMMRIPKSLGYESLEQGEFYEVMRGFCEHVAQKYWPSMTAEEIEAMVPFMVDAT